MAIMSPKTSARHSSELLIAALLCLAAWGPLAGCRSKLEVHTTNGTKAPAEKKDENTTATPVLIPDGFSSNRSYFQSRSTIAVSISSKLVSPGEQFSLLNETTKSKLIDRQALTFGLDAHTSHDGDLTAQPSYQVTVQFFPLDQETLGRFTYGSNTLRVVTDGDKAAEQEVTLRDFPISGMPLAFFDNGEQRQEGERGFQGELSLLARSVGTNGQGYLINGMMNIINQ